MNHRFLDSGSITAAAIAASLLTANLVGAQVPNPSPADGYTVPRTPNGQPDFEGFWSNATYTPLQRRDGVAGEFYTAEEVAAIEARALVIVHVRVRALHSIRTRPESGTV